jgi:hypothetical protein
MRMCRAIFERVVILGYCALLLSGASATSAGAAPAPSAIALNAFARSWASVPGYSAIVTVFEQKGTRVQNVVFDYSFRKPSSATVQVVKGQNAGVTLLWDGGSNVVAHRGSGLSAMFKKTLSLHDSQVTTIRGSSIDELSFGKILEHAQQTAGKLSVSPGPAIAGATDAVTLIPSHPGADAQYTREVIAISKTTHLPVRVLGYQGHTLVRKIDFSNVKLEH